MTSSAQQKTTASTLQAWQSSDTEIAADDYPCLTEDNLVVDKQSMVWPSEYPINAPQDVLALTQALCDITVSVLGAVDGSCAIASAYLTYLLNQRGYDARMWAGTTLDETGQWQDHCWVQCQNWRLDPTVQQFIGRENEPLVSEYALLHDAYRVGIHPDDMTGDWYLEEGRLARPDKENCLVQLKRESEDYYWDQQQGRHVQNSWAMLSQWSQQVLELS